MFLLQSVPHFEKGGLGGIRLASPTRIRLRAELAELNVRRGLPAWLAVLRYHGCEDPAAHVEPGGQAHETRLGGGDQVIQDAVGDILVEMALIAERPDVQLQAFQFDALFIRDVIQYQRGEIRLAGLGAQTGELRDLHVDMVIALGIRVGEGFQRLARLGSHIWYACSVRLEWRGLYRCAAPGYLINCESQ